MKNTGRKPTMVVDTAVSTAPPTSDAPSKTTRVMGASSVAASSFCRMLSQMMMPMSTMVPMAMAMPDRATILASTPKRFMAMKHIITAMGSSAEMRTELRRCMTSTRTTMTVTRICCHRASPRVSRVSWMRPERS